MTTKQYTVGSRTVYGVPENKAGTCIQVASDPTLGAYTRCLGMISQHPETGNWAATWNMIPSTPESFHFATAEEAVAALPRRYPHVWYEGEDGDGD